MAWASLVGGPKNHHPGASLLQATCHYSRQSFPCREMPCTEHYPSCSATATRFLLQECQHYRPTFSSPAHPMLLFPLQFPWCLGSSALFTHPTSLCREQRKQSLFPFLTYSTAKCQLRKIPLGQASSISRVPFMGPRVLRENEDSQYLLR